MLEEHKMFGATRNGYEELLCAVIAQACKDYRPQYNKKSYDKIKGKGKDKSKSWMHHITAVNFLLDKNNPYLLYFGLDGSKLIKNMDENYSKYKKTLLTFPDIRDIKQFGRILTPEERKKVYKEIGGDEDERDKEDIG